MAEEESEPREARAGMNVAEALVWLALIIAIVVLVVTGHGEWVIVAAFIAFFLL
jgi:hypothetical protein